MVSEEIHPYRAVIMIQQISAAITALNPPVWTAVLASARAFTRAKH